MKISKIVLSSVLLIASTVTFGSSNVSVEFFASNNAKIIDLQTAYHRLTGIEQTQLQTQMENIFQKNHLEQGRFEDVLGTYRMSTSHDMTADNTEQFTTSPYQRLADKSVFALAKELAVELHQDSIAVLIPGANSSGDVTLTFKGQQPSITETIALLHSKLPAKYNEAFSLHLTNTCGGFATTKVAAVEWLGSKINAAEIKKAFPTEKMISHTGKVFLVYQSGKQEVI